MVSEKITIPFHSRPFQWLKGSDLKAYARGIPYSNACRAPRPNCLEFSMFFFEPGVAAYIVLDFFYIDPPPRRTIPLALFAYILQTDNR